MALTEAEKDDCRYLLGYPSIELQTQYNLGIPQANQAQYILEGNINRILNSTAEARVRALITSIKAGRAEIDSSLTRLKASEIPGGLVLNKNEIRQRWLQDYTKVRELSMILAVPIWDHPYKSNNQVSIKR